VERDAQNRIVKVTIPGQPEVQPAAPPGPGERAGNRGGHGGRPPRGGKPSGDRPRPPQTPDAGGHAQPQAVKKLLKASPKVIGLEFTNPYTFLPFSKQRPNRRPPTPLSADELPDERGRLTGVLELDVITRSPLMSCHPEPVANEPGHKTFAALKIGPDVIVPATGIRGSLRTLLTVLTAGSLGHMDPYAHLCQGRDVNLGPRGPRSPAHTPKHVFLAEVTRAGTAHRDGEVQLGQTRLLRADALEACYQREFGERRLPRRPKDPRLWVGLDERGEPCRISKKKSEQTPWRLKISGRPVNRKGKREGAFREGVKRLVLPAELWAAYSGRNAHGDRIELRKGDLVWLEPADPEASSLDKPEDVKSIQWARWGRRGQAVKENLERHGLGHVLPDYLQGDAQVDEVTDLFGQVASQRGVRAPAFAGRIRPENLVFRDAAARVDRVTLAPLAPPHPGCIAFYRDNSDPDAVSESDPLRGYKVYRTTQERGEEAPWHFRSQGVYGDAGELTDAKRNVNKTCDLVPEGTLGTLRIAFRALTVRELALLLQACAVPWRLGGGKPLGLGLCEVRVKGLIGEDGQPLKVPDWTMNRDANGELCTDGWQAAVRDVQQRVGMWTASQTPVTKLRYPRAVEENNFKKSRGGHVWFKRHASPRMVTGRDDGAREPGLEPMYVDGELKESIRAAGEPLDAGTPMIAGQVLPPLDAAQPQADVLYGYDAYSAQSEERERPRRRVVLRLEPFHVGRHRTGKEKSEGSHGKDAGFRRDQKEDRTRKKEDSQEEGGHEKPAADEGLGTATDQ